MLSREKRQKGRRSGRATKVLSLTIGLVLMIAGTAFADVYGRATNGTCDFGAAQYEASGKTYANTFQYGGFCLAFQTCIEYRDYDSYSYHEKCTPVRYGRDGRVNSTYTSVDQWYIVTKTYHRSWSHNNDMRTIVCGKSSCHYYRY